MPVEMERNLRAQARKKGYTGERADHYVYGAMNKAGVMHGNKVVKRAKKRLAARKREPRTMAQIVAGE